jgi:hypothetical protein
MAKKSKDSGWGDIHGGQAFVIPVTLLNHPNFKRLSPHATKLLLDLGRQFGGYNNGYLHAGWGRMRKEGWNSQHTLRNAMLELEHYQILVRTRQGGKNLATLHGFTFRRVSPLKGKPLDLAFPLGPSNAWLVQQPNFEVPSSARAKSNRLMQLQHKVCAAHAHVPVKLVQPVHRKDGTDASDAPVAAPKDRELVQSVHTTECLPSRADDTRAGIGLDDLILQPLIKRRRI